MFDKHGILIKIFESEVLFWRNIFIGKSEAWVKEKYSQNIGEGWIKFNSTDYEIGNLYVMVENDKVIDVICVKF